MQSGARLRLFHYEWQLTFFHIEGGLHPSHETRFIRHNRDSRERCDNPQRPRLSNANIGAAKYRNEMRRLIRLLFPPPIMRISQPSLVETGSPKAIDWIGAACPGSVGVPPASGLNLLKRWIEVLQFHTGVCGCEVPVGFCVAAVATLAPGGELGCKRCGVGNASVEALA